MTTADNFPRGITPLAALATDRDPWDQQPGQTTKQHAAMTAWLRLPTPRKVQDLLKGSKIAVTYSTSYLYKLKQAHRWDEVAAAWDSNQHQRYVATLQREQRAAALKRLKASKEMLDLVSRAVTAIPATDVSPSAAAQMLTAVDRVQRGLFEEPDTTRVQVTGADGGPIELADWRGLPPQEQAARLREIAVEKRRQADLLAAYAASSGESDSDDQDGGN